MAKTTPARSAYSPRKTPAAPSPTHKIAGQTRTSTRKSRSPMHRDARDARPMLLVAKRIGASSLTCFGGIMQSRESTRSTANGRQRSPSPKPRELISQSEPMESTPMSGCGKLELCGISKTQAKGWIAPMRNTATSPNKLDGTKKPRRPAAIPRSASIPANWLNSPTDPLQAGPMG